MKLIYIGRHFYLDSGTLMSSFYTEEGMRCSLSDIESALIRGETVSCRDPLPIERRFYEEKLRKIQAAHETQRRNNP